MQQLITLTKGFPSEPKVGDVYLFTNREYFQMVDVQKNNGQLWYRGLRNLKFVCPIGKGREKAFPYNWYADLKFRSLIEEE